MNLILCCQKNGVGGCMWIKEGHGSKFWLLSMRLNRVVLGEVRE